MRGQLVIKVATAVLAALMACAPASAGCGPMVRELNFNGRTPRDYKDPDLLMDMAPYEYFDSTQRASIQRIGGSSYLALKMEKGCYGTTAGCGMQGRLPLYGDLDEATLRMTIRFSKGFDWVRGGKLPGLCGGTCPTGCTLTEKGFSTRIMWTDNVCAGARQAGVRCQPGRSGGLHAYSYYKKMSNARRCGEEMTFRSRRNGNIHDHVIDADRDYEMAVHVQLNTPGKSNGVITTWLDGLEMGQRLGVYMRDSDALKIEQVLIQDFFGGSSSMGARKEKHIYLKDLRVWKGYCAPHAGRWGGSQAFPDTWRQFSLDRAKFPNRGQLSIRNLRVDKAFNGGFCAKFDVTNPGWWMVKDYVVELNINPWCGSLQKYGNSLAQLSADKQRGFHVFKRRNGLEPSMSRGTTRSESFCVLASKKAQWRADQLLQFVSVNAVTDGLTIANRGTRSQLMWSTAKV